jgi:hypothetical protein
MPQRSFPHLWWNRRRAPSAELTPPGVEPLPHPKHLEPLLRAPSVGLGKENERERERNGLREETVSGGKGSE